MPRYFFHVRDSDGLSEDNEGAILPGDEQARLEALKAAREMLAEKIIRDEVLDGTQFEVVRYDGSLIAKVPLRSVMRLSE